MTYSFDPDKYPETIRSLLQEERLNDLGPGTLNQDAYAQLKALSAKDIAGSRSIKDQDMAKSCLSGLWLYHNFLDESHTLSQSIQTETGSYWHGIMHRREPDSSNSKYWFRRLGDHPIFPDLYQAAKNVVKSYSPSSMVQELLNQSSWDPFQFINLCEACRTGKAPDKDLCLHIQLQEWRILFDYCYDNAV